MHTHIYKYIWREWDIQIDILIIPQNSYCIGSWFLTGFLLTVCLVFTKYNAYYKYIFDENWWFLFIFCFKLTQVRYTSVTFSPKFLNWHLHLFYKCDKYILHTLMSYFSENCFIRIFLIVLKKKNIYMFECLLQVFRVSFVTTKLCVILSRIPYHLSIKKKFWGWRHSFFKYDC